MKEELFHQMAEVEATHWWFHARRTIVRSVLQKRLKARPARILEIGCGTGGNLELLREFGEVQAVEGDEVARGYAQGRGLANVQSGLLPDQIPHAPESFDLVVLLDVLEHVGPDADSLHAIRDLLAPGGVLLLTVPALKWLWSEHDVAHHHQRRYTREELATKLGGAGLRPELLSYFNTLLFPVVAAVRWLEKRSGRSSDADLNVPVPPVNALLDATFSFERHLLGRVPMPVGISLIALARKAG